MIRRSPHRELTRMRVGEGEHEVRRLEDAQDAALNPRRGVLRVTDGGVARARWRHVIRHAQRLHIQSAYALGEEDNPKGRRGRTVPLADQPAQALRRRFKAAREAEEEKTAEAA